MPSRSGIGTYWQADAQPAGNTTGITAGDSAAFGLRFRPSAGSGIALTVEARSHIVEVTGTDLVHWETRPLIGVMGGISIPIGH